MRKREREGNEWTSTPASVYVQIHIFLVWFGGCCFYSFFFSVFKLFTYTIYSNINISRIINHKCIKNYFQQLQLNENIAIIIIIIINTLFIYII